VSWQIPDYVEHQRVSLADHHRMLVRSKEDKEWWEIDNF